jgi:hypothetical protein
MNLYKSCSSSHPSARPSKPNWYPKRHNTCHILYRHLQTADGILARSLLPNYRQNIYLLAIGGFGPITTLEVLEALKSSQVAHITQDVDMWIVKRNKPPSTDLEEQRSIFKQVRLAPVDIDPIPEHVACRALTSLTKPDCPAHVDQMVRSPFRAKFKFAHFENYDKMYQAGTWSYPVDNKCLPSKAVTLPMQSPHASKSTPTESLWELQVRAYSNGAQIIDGIYYDQSYAPVAMIDSIYVLLGMRGSQGKKVFILDIKNDFQNTIEFDSRKRN